MPADSPCIEPVPRIHFVVSRTRKAGQSMIRRERMIMLNAIESSWEGIL